LGLGRSEKRPRETELQAQQAFRDEIHAFSAKCRRPFDVRMCLGLGLDWVQDASHGSQGRHHDWDLLPRWLHGAAFAAERSPVAQCG